MLYFVYSVHFQQRIAATPLTLVALSPKIYAGLPELKLRGHLVTLFIIKLHPSVRQSSSVYGFNHHALDVTLITKHMS